MKEMTGKKWFWLCVDFVFAAVLLAFDQLTKKLVLAKLKGNEAFVIIKDVFELDYLENRGSAFGMFQNKKVFLLCIGVLFMVVMVYILVKAPAEKKYIPIHLIASGIVAGGLGNMIDRFFLGYVVDFFSFVLIHYPIFNVADIYIVISTIGMAICLLFGYKEEDLAFLSLRKMKKEE